LKKHFRPILTRQEKKYFVTVAYPYPNSPQHIGHGRTYTLADAHARYMRMKGYNVLFPMGFHYTGTPILAMSRRVASQDKELIDTFHKVYNISDDVIQSFVNPVNIARYFHAEIKQGMEEMGYSIDWRCEFTTVDELYSKFISWQFRLLKSKGLIVQGSHPVGWCPNDQNPVSQHDTIGDVEPEFNEYILIKFQLEFEGNYYFLPAATLRPETIYGVTNLWLNPEIKYFLTSLDDIGEKWIVSTEAARKLEYLNRRISIHTTLSGKELFGKYAKNPITNKLIPIYPASFVKSDNGTGIVMSVPGHAPYDYQALADLKINNSILNNFNLGKIVNPISIISSGESQDIELFPALELIRKYQIVNQSDKKLEEATNELYLQEFYKGKMRSNTGKYEGMPVAEAKDMIKNELVTNGIADTMIELTSRPVKCRCGAECIV